MPRAILIYRLGSLGDTIVSLPCFHRIAASFPASRRIALTNEPVSAAAPRMAEILEGSGLVHGTLEYRISLRSPRAVMRLWRRLRASGADTLCYLAAPRGRLSLVRDLVFFKACGIRRIVGAPWTPDLQNPRVDPVSGEEEYESARLARCLADLGPLDLDDPSAWDLGLSDHEREEAGRVLAPLEDRPFVAVNMGGKAVENDWGEANWRALFAMMERDETDLRIVAVGGESDRARASSVGAGGSIPWVNLCGRLPPRGTAAVLARASAFLGHDSGPLHLAAACRVPCVGIFSNRHKPHKWHPYGPQHRIIHPSGPISSIAVATVREAVRDVLAATRPGVRPAVLGVVERRS